MKKILALSILAALFIFGCSKDIGVTEPVQQQVKTQAKKTLVALPAGTQMMTEEQLTIGKMIDGNRGGTIFGSKTMPGGNMRFVSFTALMSIPAGAFTGNKYITMIFDNSSASVQFTPSPTEFDKPLDLSFIVSGLVFTGMNLSNVDFVYITPQGDTEPVHYAYISTNIYFGSLAVYGAELNHFSRYGFVE